MGLLHSDFYFGIYFHFMILEVGAGNEKVWIGLKDDTWMNGDTFTVVVGIIDNLKDNKSCGMIHNNEMKSHSCQPRNMFLCEIRIA